MFVLMFVYLSSQPCLVCLSVVTVHAAITKQLSNLLVWMTSGAGEQSEVLCEVVTGFNPRLSHQHPHGLLSLKCVRTHTSYSPGETGECRPEAEVGVRDEVERRTGCGRGGCLLLALISLLGFGKALRMTALGDIFSISFAPSLVNLFSKQVPVWLTRGAKCLQTNNMAICSSGIVGFQFFHSFSNRGNDDCVIVIEPGCGW